MSVFIKSIPYNFYGWLTVIACGLFAFQIIPNFGPMKKPKSVQKMMKVIRDGATPLAGAELDEIKPIPGKPTHMLLHLVIPVVMLISIAVGTFVIFGGVKILEAFFAVVMYQSIVMALGGYFKVLRTLLRPRLRSKLYFPQYLFLSCLLYKYYLKSLGAQVYVMEVTKTWMTPAMLPAITFAAGACISFFTGTSWGTYALLVPFSIPIAFNLSGET